ncbi:hypothetical protein EZS27_000689 [termite gut metagenome]|uniref:FrrB n=1 Tax=termite gut metagenome TaxID=433724 RepID=A0A5J4T2T8_9ZZZZ
MKKINVKWVVALFPMFFVSMVSNAQNKPEVSVGADIVNSYIWRGIDSGGASFQPSVSVSLNGFSLAAWGSTGLDKTDTKELDFTLKYAVNKFSAAITDYWFNTGEYFNYDADITSHVYEATLGYDFGALSLSWNTNFSGNDYKADGKRAYSTYIEAAVPFGLGSYDFKVEAGFTPWEGIYAGKFNVTNIGLTASKSIQVTGSFTVPAFVKLVANPSVKGAYLVFGVSL